MVYLYCIGTYILLGWFTLLSYYLLASNDYVMTYLYSQDEKSSARMLRLKEAVDSKDYSVFLNSALFGGLVLVIILLAIAVYLIKVVLNVLVLVYNSCVKFVKTVFKKLFKGKK